MDAVTDRILIFFLISEMFVTETPFGSEIIFKTIDIGICRNPAHIRQGRFTPVICITGAEIPAYIFQVYACFTEDFIPAGNKFADMGSAGEVVVLSANVSIPSRSASRLRLVSK